MTDTSSGASLDAALEIRTFVPQISAHGAIHEPGTTWWLTGLPGAGKTTLAHALAAALRASGTAACVLDGDELRIGLCQELGYSHADRAENVRRAGCMAQLLNANGICAIVAMVSPDGGARRRAYAAIGLARCIEVHVSTPLEVCEMRDPKGLYARARARQMTQMTGVQAAYEAPLTPALRIDTSMTAPSVAVVQMLTARDQAHLPPSP